MFLFLNSKFLTIILGKGRSTLFKCRRKGLAGLLGGRAALLVMPCRYRSAMVAALQALSIDKGLHDSFPRASKLLEDQAYPELVGLLLDYKSTAYSTARERASGSLDLVRFFNIHG